MTAPPSPGPTPRTPDALDTALAALRPAVAFPATPDLASSVSRVVLSAAPVIPPLPPVIPSGAKVLGAARQPDSVSTPRPSPPAPRPSLVRPLALTSVALVLLLGAALSGSGDLRGAVADRLGIPGIRIELVDETPTTDPSSSLPPRSSPAPVGPTLLLGEPVSLTAAQAAVPYAIRIPPALGAPDEVYLRQLPDGPMVALVYRARPGLPQAAETGVGALLLQFPASSDGGDIAKKILIGSGSLLEVSIGNGYGYWVTGSSELMIMQDPSGSAPNDPSRPSANVLLWASGGVTYRLETALPLADALALAESLAAADADTPTP